VDPVLGFELEIAAEGMEDAAIFEDREVDGTG
jgi:hypothetical protein